MAQFRFPQHPWDPNYRLPPSVRAEPPGRGTITTKGLDRRFIDSPPVSSFGYAAPGYVMSEQPGRGAFVTNMLPRRFVDAKPPDYLAAWQARKRAKMAKRPATGARGSLSGGIFDRHVFSPKKGNNR